MARFGAWGGDLFFFLESVTQGFFCCQGEIIMANIGAFGDCVFTVSSFKILTFDNYKRTTKHRYVKHDIFNYKPKLESVGPELEEIEMKIKFMVSLGVDPKTETEKLREMCRTAECNYLIIGAEVIGGGLFVIEEISEEVISWSGTGKIISSEVEVKFKEYVIVGDY